MEQIFGGDLIFPEQLGTDDRCILIDGSKLKIENYVNIVKEITYVVLLMMVALFFEFVGSVQ